MSDQMAVDLLSSYLRMDLSAQPVGPAAIARPRAQIAGPGISPIAG
ncbi:nitrilotriacetate monooxygenase [Klebsiella pneumoniae]|nr:nitrilotriacetate monooxygenase [Klebsiella pneumoniae]